MTGYVGTTKATTVIGFFSCQSVAILIQRMNASMRHIRVMSRYVSGPSHTSPHGDAYNHGPDARKGTCYLVLPAQPDTTRPHQHYHQRLKMAITDSSPKETPYLEGWRLAVVITCLFFGSFLIALDANIINVAIPQISSDFQALDDVAWYGTGYLLTVTAFQPVYGCFYRFFRTDIVYRVSIFIFEVGTILCAAATSSPMFIVGRAIAGFGAAGVLQGALSIIGQVVQLEKRPLYMGIVISVFVITVCIGPPLGGVFTQHATWRWCFWINLPFGAVVLGGLTIFLKVNGQENEERRLPLPTKLASMDPLGCAIFLGAVCCLLLALQWGGQTKSWTSSTIIGLLVGTAALALLFVYVQSKRGDRALISLRVFCRRSVFTSAMVLFFLGGSTYLDTYILPFYFEAVHGISPVSSGVNFIPLMLSEMVTLVFIGAVVKQWGQYVPYILVGELICIVGTALLSQLHPLTRTVQWAAYLVVTGFGLGLAMQLPYTAIQVTLSSLDLPIGNGRPLTSNSMPLAIFVFLSNKQTV
ncbi:efflux pump antibiotic resistance protein, putative [Talaromyces stipitatus ATCC 10500]|uniref:Efflux pump antibiotic resistance protein, putative n=1 Tax=Talaromyces stipitatus (strain ATCC 10500 / CBS 375.48 / QM 6759 / NRRL 1006) TaxID=441959 RepID=B8MN19_TALSN|nr:efflux pump antibiotic resistance protein, putative [Talaromyces stipitatus ATCC 10500]XP_002486207.1 efflux pump antibiotic resistance protein, putative [Talaromyces stipitatus ATCC 10500]XP_002486208.1 efflux pump antibiotic resistance protein, putative [Talaromyces stipitatus ATCC 10500]EED13968.1 efflux pump antibiotic resistance protein, putative [Talaromyces stipitatus ATCC 10500]EED13969.1 efflux pump antibiotic resistance protein, putative [Talaromyces stipitatus ATCC 10500]EED13970